MSLREWDFVSPLLLSIQRSLALLRALSLTLSHTIVLSLSFFHTLSPTLMLMWNIQSIVIQFWLMACKCFLPPTFFNHVTHTPLKLRGCLALLLPYLLCFTCVCRHCSPTETLGNRSHDLVVFNINTLWKKGLILNSHKNELLPYLVSWLAHPPLELRCASLDSCGEVCWGRPVQYCFCRERSQVLISVTWALVRQLTKIGN